jgi:inorganic pyrophosphatase/exopolyphosphatase
MRIITSGSRYLDIDGYAGCAAYAELLQTMGITARAVSTAPMNESIPPIVRAWQVTNFSTEYAPSAGDTYTLIDVSEPEYFDAFVDMAAIDEVIDHHPGLEAYWQQRIGTGAVIEQVGAACTQIFERWEQAGLVDQMSETGARLLMCGILDNTLNFGADITTERDHHAYAVLKAQANLPEDWPARYFSDCQSSITSDMACSIENDTKVLTLQTYPHKLAIGQCAIWDAESVARQSQAVFKQALQKAQPQWLMNAISIGQNKSYFVSDVPQIQEWLSDLLGVSFQGNLAVADRMWLRKEIIKADIDQAAQ